MLCREWTLVKHVDNLVIAEPLKCRCWHCDYCQPIRCNQLKALARSGHPNTFLTLTVNPRRGTSPDDRARQLSRAWRLLRLRAMRKYGYRELPFLAVFERTKRGEPHLHLLLRVKWLDQRWLSRQMAELIGAPIVDIRRVHGPKGAARYIAKYVGKDPHSFKGVKRYWRSQDYSAPHEADQEGPYVPPDTVCVVRKDVMTFIRHAVEDGYTASRGEGEAWNLTAPARGPLWDRFFQWRDSCNPPLPQ